MWWVDHLEYFHVALVVLNYLLGLHFLASHHLDNKIVFGQKSGSKVADVFDELLVHLLEIAFEVWVGGHVSARMWQQEVGHFRETRGQTFPERL